jgi:hypothetical protein
MTIKRRNAKEKDIPDILKQEPKNTIEDIEARIHAMGGKTPDEAKKEREAEYYRQHTTKEKYTGSEVGFAFLHEFIRVYKGSVVDIIPDEERLRMVKSLDNYEDMAIYQKYREIYWHFLVKVNEHERQVAEAKYWYLKLKLAIADGDQMRKDETDDTSTFEYWSWFLSPTGESPKNNLEKIQTIFAQYKRMLYVCRCIEVGIEIIAQALGIDNSPFRGMELFGTYFDEANKLARTHKELGLKPIRKKDLEPGRAVIKNARYAASFIENEPDRVHDVFHDMLEI